MEDVLVLDQMLDQFKDDLLKAFNEYSRHRNPDAEAICDLAMYNYVEVMHLAQKFYNARVYARSRVWVCRRRSHVCFPDARPGGKTVVSPAQKV